jgi:Ricin-type beta-trefoil lectin domain-like
VISTSADSPTSPRRPRSTATTADKDVNLEQASVKLSVKAHLIDELPVRSVTTYVIEGLSPLSISASPSSATIEGTHQVVSVGTKLCLNINQNSTRSGEAILPYPCSGFSNMQFNFVDQGNGLCAIQTVNGAKRLCLNVSTGTATPGDGKTYGGPGNLIQWTCSDGPLPSNELFEIVDVGNGRVQIRVKSSGLCLADPGRGGTIRQDRCNPSNLNQVFTLPD